MPDPARATPDRALNDAPGSHARPLWLLVALSILAMLVICTALIVIAATRG
jgi:hypothetical protein